jgi:predicted RNA-binding Zn-ribbon protein involved in translation (DUF1610 family)
MYYMRLESCRTCGLEMKPDLQCEICKNFTRLHCPKCGKSGDAQIHIHQNLSY